MEIDDRDDTDRDGKGESTRDEQDDRDKEAEIDKYLFERDSAASPSVLRLTCHFSLSHQWAVKISETCNSH